MYCVVLKNVNIEFYWCEIARLDHENFYHDVRNKGYNSCLQLSGHRINIYCKKQI